MFEEMMFAYQSVKQAVRRVRDHQVIWGRLGFGPLYPTADQAITVAKGGCVVDGVTHKQPLCVPSRASLASPRESLS